MKTKRAAAAVVVLCVIAGGVLGTAAAAQGAAVLRGVSVAGVQVAGLESSGLVARLSPAARVAEERPLTLSVGDRSWTRRPIDLGIEVDVPRTAARALRAGRENPIRWVLQTLSGEDVSLTWSLNIDTAKLRKAMAEIADLVRIEAANGQIDLEGRDVVVKPPTIGVSLVTDAARSRIIKATRRPPAEPRLALPVTIKPPPIGEEEVARVESQAREILAKPAEFILEGKVITLPPELLAKTLLIRVGQDPRADDREHLLLLVDPPSLEAELVAAAPSAAIPPKDATFAVEGASARVIASADGRSVDTVTASETLLRFGSGEERRPIEIQFKPVPPDFNTEAARALGITERISVFTTNFDPANAPRVSNIDQMASSIDGTIVKPGETFSLNDTTGPRTPERGYREAQIIVNGELVPGIGGGVCQVGTTLFNAAFFAGFPIAERSNHSLYISKYPLGRDATVNFGHQDLKFRNDTPYGFLLKAVVTSKALTINIYSSKLGRTVEYTTSEKRSIKPPPTKYIDDPALPAGQEVVAEEGSPGFDVTVRRTVRDGQDVLHQGTFVSKYRPWTRIVRRGTGPPAPAPQPSPSA